MSSNDGTYGTLFVDRQGLGYLGGQQEWPRRCRSTPGRGRDLRGGPDVGKRKRAREVVKLNEWVTKLWLPVMRSQLKESTFDSYRRNMENHVLPRLGDVPLDEITPRMLTDTY